MPPQVLLSFLGLGLLWGHVLGLPADVEVIYEWPTMEWDWTATPYDSRESAIAAGYYNPNITVICTLQVETNPNGGDSRIFALSPRISGPGVPAQLNTIGDDGKLVPYPDTATSAIGDCEGLQGAQGMNLDPRGEKLYVVDSGRVGLATPTPQNNCPAKVMVISTETDALETIYEFPDEVVNSTFNFLNDIVLDYVNQNASSDASPKYAYMSEPMEYRIVVLDLTTAESWYYQHPSMLGDAGGFNVTIAGFTAQLPPSPINGIILSPTFDYVYYSAITSKDLWQIPTSVLRQKGGDFAGNVRKVGSKASNSDSMFGGRNAMYYGGISGDAFYSWEFAKDLEAAGGDESQITLSSEVQLAQDDVAIQWPDGISIDRDHNLYFISDRAQLLGRGFDPNGGMGSNIRILRKAVNDSSYIDFNLP